jgi:hypothetical protein
VILELRRNLSRQECMHETSSMLRKWLHHRHPPSRVGDRDALSEILHMPITDDKDLGPHP